MSPSPHPRQVLLIYYSQWNLIYPPPLSGFLPSFSCSVLPLCCQSNHPPGCPYQFKANSLLVPRSFRHNHATFHQQINLSMPLFPAPSFSRRFQVPSVANSTKSILLSQAFTVPTTYQQITVFSSLTHSVPHYEPLFTGEYQHTRLCVF